MCGGDAPRGEGRKQLLSMDLTLVSLPEGELHRFVGCWSKQAGDGVADSAVE